LRLQTAQIPDAVRRAFAASACFLTCTALTAPVALAGKWPFSDRSTTEQRFPVEQGALVTIDNVNGPIEVVGEDRRDVQLVAVRTTSARSQAALARANEEVRLDIDASPESVVFYVDGPFRCGQNCINDRGRNDYSVRYEITLRVPRRTDLDVQTVNDGEVVVRGVDGIQEVNNVNGGIEMTEIGGAVCAGAVNGEVHVVFTSSPRDSCSFESVNGDLDVTFPGDLSADVRVKTFNGEVYSAFDGTPLPPRAATVKAHKGGTTYKIDGRTGLRIGAGKVPIEFDALNGDVRLRRLER
jgi:hypothetical protein